jgi:pyruvate formate lyase activating enzyme
MNDHSGFRDLLFDHAIPAASELFIQTEDGVQCLACANRCKIADGAEGACRMRFVRRGEFYVPGGYVAGLNVDPIEKKPFFNVLPGRDALSFGMLGCNFHCPFCQNWRSSQALKDPESMGSIHSIRPEHLADMAVEQNVPVIVSTYNEPLISADWSAKIFARAKENGILCGFVSNGCATPEAVNFIRPFVDIFKVDLKCFDTESYSKLGGNLKSVLETITTLKEKGVWVEIVTLLVPGFNDSEEQLRGMTSFISGLSRDIPWHVTAFHPDYMMNDARQTDAKDIERAAGFGKDAGLHFVYAGNLPGQTKGMENTYCPKCKNLLIERIGFKINSNRMRGAHCPDCDAVLPGMWEENPPKHASHSGAFRRVL